MTSKAAECIRTVANFSTVLPEFKFDKSKFDKEKLKESLPDISPKLVKLFKLVKLVFFYYSSDYIIDLCMVMGLQALYNHLTHYKRFSN